MSRSPDRSIGIIIVDHGSRSDDSNTLLLEAVERFRRLTGREIVEPAHMELAAPDISEAFTACVQRGARHVIVFPYFLSPGRHWKHDIPELVRRAARPHAGVTWQVTPPFGLHDALLNVVEERIREALDDSRLRAGRSEPPGRR